MRDCGLVIVLVVGALLVLWFLIDIHARRRQLATALSHLPDVRIVTAGSSLAETYIAIAWPPRDARVRYLSHPLRVGGRMRKRPYTEFSAELEDAPIILRAATPEWCGVLGAFFNTHRVGTGDAAFDARYEPRGVPEAAVAGFLDGTERERIERARGLGFGALTLEVRPDLLTLRIDGWLQEPAALRALVDYGLEACARAEGVIVFERVSEGPAAACRVCGAAIEAERRVVCRKCRTPHHDDCWKYNGRCSIFACGEQRSEKE